jgi:O-antigen ligase
LNNNFIEMKAWIKKFPLQALLFPLAFFAYPLVLISPQGVTLFREVFLFRLPIELLMSGLSLCWIIKNSDKLKLKKFPSYMIMAFVGSALISFILNKSHAADLLISLNFILVMTCVAVSFGDENNRRGGLFFVSFFFSIILLLNLTHYLFFNSTVGIGGNRNWFSAILCTCLPFFIHFSLSYLKNKYLKYTLIIAISLLTFKALLVASSRASFLALGLLLFFFLIRKLNGKIKLLILLVLFSIPLLVPKLFPAKYEKFLLNDIRKELWTSNAYVIKDNLLGVGQGNFKKTFPNYTQEGYKRHLINSDETTHPHNQFILVAIEDGVLACLALIIICLVLLNRSKFADKDEWPFLAAFFILLIQGFFDKVLDMPPMSMTLGLCAAYLWRNELSFKVCESCPNRKKYLKYGAIIFAILLSLLFIRDFLAHLKYREGFIIFKGAQEEKYDEGRQLLEDAVKYKGRDLDYKYTLMRAYGQSLNLPEEALKEALEISQISPSYKRINRHLANFYAMKGDRNKVELYREKDVYDFPWDINSIIELINTKISLGKTQDIEALVRELDKVSEDRFLAYAQHYFSDLDEFRTKWQMQDTYKKWYTFTELRLRALQYNESEDKFFNMSNKYPELKSYYSFGFNKLDAEFWLEMQQINKNFTHKNMDQIFVDFKTKYSINNELKYTSPQISLKQKQLSSVSYYSLLAVALRQKGILSSLMMKANICVGLVYINDKQTKVFDTSIRSLNEEDKKLDLYSFYYPQNCSLRNYLLSTILNSDGQFYELSPWPIVDIINFNKASGLRVNSVIPFPFAEMNEKLK